jgi:hypothetical protein
VGVPRIAAPAEGADGATASVFEPQADPDQPHRQPLTDGHQTAAAARVDGHHPGPRQGQQLTLTFLGQKFQ